MEAVCPGDGAVPADRRYSYASCQRQEQQVALLEDITIKAARNRMGIVACTRQLTCTLSGVGMTYAVPQCRAVRRDTPVSARLGSFCPERFVPRLWLCQAVSCRPSLNLIAFGQSHHRPWRPSHVFCHC